MKRHLISLLLCLACVLPLGACAPAENSGQQPAQMKKYENMNETPVDGGTLKLCLFETDSLNPLVTKNSENIQTLKLIYDSLFIVNQDLSYTPNLCESYSLSDDGLTYRFQIKSGVLFHDGTRLTASDADFSLRLITEAEGPYAAKLLDIKSHSASGQTLQITLKRPVANFPALLDFPVVSERAASSPKKAIEDKAEYVPNGTGLYKVQSYQKNKELFLTKNDAYHRGLTPHIGNILVSIVHDRAAAITMLENLRVDLLSSRVVHPSEYTPKRDVSSIDFATNQFTYLGFNNEAPALRTALTRRAISMALDRSALVSTHLSGRATACDIPIHPSSWLYRKDQAVSAFDPQQAKSLLTEDGWTDSDNDGKLDRQAENGIETLELTLLVNQENAQRVKLANQIKGWLEDIGIWVTVSQLPFSSYADRLNEKRFDMAVCEVDISDNCDLKFLLETGYNIYGVANEMLDSLMQQADKTDSATQTQELYWEMCTLLQQDMPLCGLYFKNASVIFDDSLRGNILPSTSSLFGNVHEWFLKTE